MKQSEGTLCVRRYSESVFHVLNFDVLPTPIFTIIFSQAPQNGRDLPQIVQNAILAFRGNGIIHLNVAEIYEEDIGGQKTCAYFGNQGSKRPYLAMCAVRGMKKVKAFRPS